ncbi:MAG TPA: potassium channel protein [Acidimicrobiales bacterium]
MHPWRRLRLGLGGVALVLVVGWVGYWLLGLSPLDAIYQTVTTVTTVGFGEFGDFGPAERAFTMVLILVGTGTVLYTFTVLLEALVEGHVSDVFGRRRMERKISELENHVIVCGWGRVGRALSQFLGPDQDIVVIDRDPERIATVPHLTVEGDATEDMTLAAAGITRARALVAALNGDADNLFVTVTGRALCPELFIVARVRTVNAEEKLRRAGADRVVNPQQIGGMRMAAFVMQPHVSEFLDVVMHDQAMEFRLEELVVPEGSKLCGVSLRESQIRDLTGALVLALRDDRGAFRTNPPPESTIDPGDVLIAIGTGEQLEALRRMLEP